MISKLSNIYAKVGVSALMVSVSEGIETFLLEVNAQAALLPGRHQAMYIYTAYFKKHHTGHERRKRKMSYHLVTRCCCSQSHSNCMDFSGNPFKSYLVAMALGIPMLFGYYHSIALSIVIRTMTKLSAFNSVGALDHPLCLNVPILCYECHHIFVSPPH